MYVPKRIWHREIEDKRILRTSHCLFRSSFGLKVHFESASFTLETCQNMCLSDHLFNAFSFGRFWTGRPWSACTIPSQNATKFATRLILVRIYKKMKKKLYVCREGKSSKILK